ncbi:hypothetical protein ACFL1F_01135 [Chlamydiota bacterium]
MAWFLAMFWIYLSLGFLMFLYYRFAGKEVPGLLIFFKDRDFVNGSYGARMLDPEIAEKIVGILRSIALARGISDEDQEEGLPEEGISLRKFRDRVLTYLILAVKNISNYYKSDDRYAWGDEILQKMLPDIMLRTILRILLPFRVIFHILMAFKSAMDFLFNIFRMEEIFGRNWFMKKAEKGNVLWKITRDIYLIFLTFVYVIMAVVFSVIALIVYYYKRFFKKNDDDAAYAKELSPGDEEPFSSGDIGRIEAQAEPIDDHWREWVGELNKDPMVPEDRRIELFVVQRDKPYLEGEKGQRKYAVGIPVDIPKKYLRVYMSQELFNLCEDYPILRKAVLALLLHETLDRGKKKGEGSHAWAWQMMKDHPDHNLGMFLIQAVMILNLDKGKVGRLITEFKKEAVVHEKGWSTEEGGFEKIIYDFLVRYRKKLEESPARELGFSGELMRELVSYVDAFKDEGLVEAFSEVEEEAYEEPVVGEGDLFGDDFFSAGATADFLSDFDGLDGEVARAEAVRAEAVSAGSPDLRLIIGDGISAPDDKEDSERPVLRLVSQGEMDQSEQVLEIMFNLLSPIIVSVVGRDRVITYVAAQYPNSVLDPMIELQGKSDRSLAAALGIYDWFRSNREDIRALYRALFKKWPEGPSSEELLSLKEALIKEFRSFYAENPSENADDLQTIVLDFVKKAARRESEDFSGEGFVAAGSSSTSGGLGRSHLSLVRDDPESYAKEISAVAEAPLSPEDIKQIEDRAVLVEGKWHDYIVGLNNDELVNDKGRQMDLFVFPSDGYYLEGSEKQKKYAMAIPGKDGRLKVYVTRGLLNFCDKHPLFYKAVLALLVHESLDRGKDKGEGSHAWAWQQVKNSEDHLLGMTLMMMFMIVNLDDSEKIDKLMGEFEKEIRSREKGWDTGQDGFERVMYKLLILMKSIHDDGDVSDVRAKILDNFLEEAGSFLYRQDEMGLSYYLFDIKNELLTVLNSLAQRPDAAAFPVLGRAALTDNAEDDGLDLLDSIVVPKVLSGEPGNRIVSYFDVFGDGEESSGDAAVPVPRTAALLTDDAWAELSGGLLDVVVPEVLSGEPVKLVSYSLSDFPEGLGEGGQDEDAASERHLEVVDDPDEVVKTGDPDDVEAAGPGMPDNLIPLFPGLGELLSDPRVALNRLLAEPDLISRLSIEELEFFIELCETYEYDQLLAILKKALSEREAEQRRHMPPELTLLPPVDDGDEGKGSFGLDGLGEMAGVVSQGITRAEFSDYVGSRLDRTFGEGVIQEESIVKDGVMVIEKGSSVADLQIFCNEPDVRRNESAKKLLMNLIKYLQKDGADLADSILSSRLVLFVDEDAVAVNDDGDMAIAQFGVAGEDVDSIYFAGNVLSYLLENNKPEALSLIVRIELNRRAHRAANDDKDDRTTMAVLNEVLSGESAGEIERQLQLVTDAVLMALAHSIFERIENDPLADQALKGAEYLRALTGQIRVGRTMVNKKHHTTPADHVQHSP